MSYQPNTWTLFLLAESTTTSMTAVMSFRLHHILHEDTRWFMLYLKLHSHKSSRIKQHQESHQQMKLHQIPQLELTAFINNTSQKATAPQRAATAVGVQLWVRRQYCGDGTSAVVFTADPRELGLSPEVRWFQDGEPAALAGVRPETPPPVQFGPELLPVGRVVSAQRPMMV